MFLFRNIDEEMANALFNKEEDVINFRDKVFQYEEENNYPYGNYEIMEPEINPTPESWIERIRKTRQESFCQDKEKFFILYIDDEIGIFTSREKAIDFIRQINAQLIISGYETRNDYFITDIPLNPNLEDLF